MNWILYVFAALVVCFGFVVFFGAPYLPTLNRQMTTALDLLDLRPGQTLLELGSGDGKVLVAAARRGLNAVGYEINPILALYAWIRTRRYRGQVRVVCGNFWRREWPPAEGIFVFLLDKYMPKLDTKIVQWQPKHTRVKLVSFAFKVPGKKPVQETNGLFLYEYR